MQNDLRGVAAALALPLALVLSLARPAAAEGRVPGLVALVGAVPAAKLGSSYRPGCPVPPGDLRLISMNHWGFDGAVHRGELIVHKGVVTPVLSVFDKAFAEHFPIRRMKIVAEYGTSDTASMAADNTSAFNCRRVTGDPSRISQHAYGDAIDINPLENPYVDPNGKVHPAAGERYLDRDQDVMGMIQPGDVITTAFAANDWLWGGRWHAPDYQHFSSNGR